MKKIMKRVLLIALVLIMAFSVMPFSGMITAQATEIRQQPRGTIITYGSYPQTKVTDSSLVSALNAKSKTWISYGYYTGSGSWCDGQMKPSDYMKYADISYNGQKYRAVTFTQYRPECTSFTSSADNSCQDENGYTPNNVYYFKYEPLKWRILDPSEGLVMCENIIDSQAYNNYILYANNEYYGDSAKTYYSSNWAKSSLRAWLNNDFYNTAFSSSEKNVIKTSFLENKSTSSSYDAPSTYDKVFLLSYWDAINSNYGFSSSYSDYDTARRAQGTDYAKCQGLWVWRSSGSSYDGNSYWWLRTPGDYSRYASYVGGSGGVYYGGFYVDCNYYGVRPALKFNPKSSIPGLTGVSINDISLDYKSSTTLKPTITADEGATYTVAFTSSNPSVATVDNGGKVYGAGAGTATITVTVTDNNGNTVTDTCTVTVNAPKVKSVTIEDASINYLSTIVIKPTITSDEGANYTVTYSSSDTSVAMVDENGKVTSVKQSGFNRGSTVITCTVTDSNGNVVTDTCKVTVQFTWWQWLIKIALFGWIWY